MGHLQPTPIPFDYTHVLYDPTSTKAKILAFFTLTPILLFASYAALIVYNREMTMILMLVGQLLNEFMNTQIKHVVQIERPLSSHGTGYAFPSSHSQFMGYFATFLTLHIARRHRFPMQSLHYIVPVILWSWAGLVAYSRWHLHYHTLLQVAGGLAIGVASGIGWYSICSLLPRKAILNHGVAEYARIRDGWLVYPDGGHEEEWKAWHSKVKAKQG